MAKPLFWMVVFAVCLAFSNSATAQPSSAPPNNDGLSLPPVAPGPRVVDALPGQFQSALVAPANFMSPFASLLSPSSRPSSSTELRDYYQSTSRARLLEAPEMFGDFRRAGPILVMTPTTGTLPGLQTEIPVAAGISGLRAAENNQALPSDRVWVAYNYFNNAFDVRTDGSFGLTPQSDSQSLHRSVVAFETLLDCGQTSLEMRMPFGAAFNAEGVAGLGGGATPYGVTGENLGNLNLLLKRLLYADDTRAWSVGLGLELPTGSTGEVTYGNLSASLEPEAVHFVPFLAATQRRGRWFGHFFTQLDIASHGDPFRATLNTPGASELVGRIDQPVLFGVDLGAGYWLIPPCNCGRGLAVVGEVHYTTPLDDDDDFTATGVLTDISINTPVGPAYEVLHFTTGLQLALGNGWKLRSGVVLPALEERVFDTEYLLQINRGF